jgi:hypothetical protein
VSSKTTKSMRAVFSLPASEDEVYGFACLKGRLVGRFWRFVPFLPPSAYRRPSTSSDGRKLGSAASFGSRRQAAKSGQLPVETSVMLQRGERV